MIDGAAGYVLRVPGRTEDSAALLRRAYAAVDDGSEDEAVADLAARRAAIEYQLGDTDESLRLSDIALRISDGLRLWQVVVRALANKGNSLAEVGRPAGVDGAAHLTPCRSRSSTTSRSRRLAPTSTSLTPSWATAASPQPRRCSIAGLLLRGAAVTGRGGGRLLAQRRPGSDPLGRWDEALDRVAVVQEGADDIWARQVVPFIPYVLSARSRTWPRWGHCLSR